MVIDDQVICKEVVVKVILKCALLNEQRERHARIRSSADWVESLIIRFITSINV